MKIKRMTATFGCLDHQTLELEEGLNILTMPNEGGKSTWCAFLRVMLYGLNTRERDKKGFLADKTRYQPWNGGAMEGELLCTWQGKDILIRRYTKGSTPMGGFEVTYADSGSPVPGLTADNLGDVLVGVSRSVFERSAFLGQAALPVSQTPELEKRLSALVSSGEEDVSATQVRDTLSDWQRKRQYRTKGAIPTLEARRGELNLALETVRDVTSQIRSSKMEIDKYDEMRSKLKHQIDLYHAKSDSAQAQAYAQAEGELKQAQQQLERLQAQLPEQGLPPKEELERARDEVAQLRGLDNSLKQAAQEVPAAQEALEAAQTRAEDPVYSGEAAEARSKAQSAQQQIEVLERKTVAAARNSWLLPVILIVVAAVAFGAAYAVTGTLALLPGLGAGALALLGVVLGLVSHASKKRCQAEVQKLLQQFQVETKQEISQKAEDYCARLSEAQKAREALERTQKAESDLEQQRQSAWNDLRDLVDTFAPEVKDVFGFSAAITRALTLLDSLDKARQRRESAQRLFDTVAAHGKGCAGAIAEEPSVTLEQAQAGFQEAERRLNSHHNDLSMAMGRRSTLGDPETIQAEIESIDRTLESCRRDYEALQIALEALEEADAEMRNRFSPELNRRSGAYLEALTSGKYPKVRLNRSLEAGAEEQGGVVVRSILSLSQGTADQLWLAVRLAVCDLALPQEERCPLVLDDALVNFDDQRVVPALGLLKQLSQDRQILLFSCHDREENLVKGGAI